MIAWVLLGGALFSVVLIVFWLSNAPPKRERSQYTLPPLKSRAALEREVDEQLKDRLRRGHYGEQLRKEAEDKGLLEEDVSLDPLIRKLTIDKYVIRSDDGLPDAAHMNGSQHTKDEFVREMTDTGGSQASKVDTSSLPPVTVTEVKDDTLSHSDNIEHDHGGRHE